MFLQQQIKKFEVFLSLLIRRFRLQIVSPNHHSSTENQNYFGLLKIF